MEDRQFLLHEKSIDVKEWADEKVDNVMDEDRKNKKVNHFVDFNFLLLPANIIIKSFCVIIGC